MLAYIASINSRHRKTLEAVFVEPTKTNILWSDIEALLVAAGCDVLEGSGSRVRFDFKGHIVFFHRPHPQKEAIRYQVKQAREFLAELGVKP